MSFVLACACVYVDTHVAHFTLPFISLYSPLFYPELMVILYVDSESHAVLDPKGRRFASRCRHNLRVKAVFQLRVLHTHVRV